MSDYVDEELSEDDRRRLERHAGICPECGPMLRTLAVLVWELRGLGRRRPAKTIAPGVVERIRSEPAPPKSAVQTPRLR